MSANKLKSGKGCFLIGLPILSIFCGFLMGTAGLAVFPSLSKISEPVLGNIEVTSNSYHYGGGRSGTDRTYYVNGEKKTFMVMFVSFLMYSVIIYVVLVIPVFLFRISRPKT